MLEKKLAIDHERKVNFPMYNIKLNNEQYNKLFYGKPFKTKRTHRR